ncbi:MAG: acylneuraminate cytidylyltransferase family protein [Actinomycetota bacterium]
MKISDKFLGIIPARAGSRGIPGKNLRPLAGKPLIAHAIAQALGSRLLDAVVVSTEDEEIAFVAREYGAEVPFIRPAELAGDDSPMMRVLEHSLDELEAAGRVYENAVCLQPTSPLRTSRHIDEAIDLFAAGDPGALASVCEVRESPYWMVTVQGDVGTPFVGGGWERTTRQSLPELYRLNGAIYILDRELLKGLRSLPERLLVYRMEARLSLDIDDETDWMLAEAAMEGS